ncbi:MAG: polysaccharide biosynthesis protein, partial [Oscillospiraceae bacterium]|nr:polysaccharide biosynthesis protein [Oscillospiraceae bacterium]
MSTIKTDTGSSARSFLKGAAILSLSMVAVKLCGVIYKVALTNLYGTMGSEFAAFGSGIFGMTYELYVVLFTLATAGFPIAVSRLISESTAQGRYNDVRRIHNVSKPFFIITGLVFFVIMFFSSFIYVKLIESPYALYPVMALSPLTFFGCLVAIYRGYFEGMRNMAPTAVSEVIEAATKLIIGFTAAYIVTNNGIAEYNASGTVFGMVFANKTEAFRTLVSYSVTAAIAGITLGSVFCFLFLILRFKFAKPIPQEYYRNSVDARSRKETFTRLVKTAVPIGLAALVMSVAGFIDQMVIQRVIYNTALTNPHELLAQFGGLMDTEIKFDAAGQVIEKDINIHTSLVGCYGNALTIIHVITALTQVFGTSAMPNVTNAFTRGNKGELKNAIETVLRLTTIVTFPMGLGAFVLADPIMNLLFNGSVAIIGANVLRVLGISVIFIGCSTPMCSMLQGIGKVSMPLKLFIVGMIIKVIVNFSFVSIVQINIVGAATGSLVAYVIIDAAATYQLCKHSGVIPNFLATVFKPLLGAIVCGVSAY